jgi:hypothetical protein
MVGNRDAVISLGPAADPVKLCPELVPQNRVINHALGEDFLPLAQDEATKAIIN